MLWVILSVIGAVSNAVYFISTKKFLQRVDPIVLAGGSFFFAGIFLFTTAMVNGIPPIGDELFIAIAGTSVLNIIATVLVYRALRSTAIALSVPLLSFTPIFLVGTSFVLLHEIPSLIGIAGICTTVTGSYILHVSSSHSQFFDPLRSIFRNRGALYMLVVAFIYSVSLNFDKMVVLNSDPVFGSSLVCVTIGSSFFMISFFYYNSAKFHGAKKSQNITFTQRTRNLMSQYRADALIFIFIGLVLTVEAVSIFSAFMLQIVPYVISIKRTSILMAVLYGTIISEENEIAWRFSGAAIMLAGVILIVLFN